MPYHSVAPVNYRRSRTSSSAIAAAFARARHPTAALSTGFRHCRKSDGSITTIVAVDICVEIYVSRISPFHQALLPRQGVGEFSLGAVAPGSRTRVIHLHQSPSFQPLSTTPITHSESFAFGAKPMAIMQAFASR